MAHPTDPAREPPLETVTGAVTTPVTAPVTAPVTTPVTTPLQAPVGRALLDAASGPLHPVARDTLLAALDAGWADPRRLYAEARTARRLLDQAREVVASGLGVRPGEIAFLPTGPIALSAGVEGVRYGARRRGRRVVASAVEHSAVLVSARDAAARAEDAALLEEVGVDASGQVDLDRWQQALAAPGSVVAALQSANGEVGTRQPLEAAHLACRQHAVPLVVDAMAGLGRDAVPTDFDVLVGDARSWGGPPVGVLVLRDGVRWQRPAPPAEAEGGRSDAEPFVPLVLAAAEAWQQTAAVAEADASTARNLVDRIRSAAAALPDTEVAGAPVARLPHVVTFSCLFADGEAVVDELDRRGFAVASGSACTASTLEPSHVLAAMGVLTHGNVRVTLPLEAVAPRRAEDVERFCATLPDVVAAVRERLGTGRL